MSHTVCGRVQTARLNDEFLHGFLSARRLAHQIIGSLEQSQHVPLSCVSPGTRILMHFVCCAAMDLYTFLEHPSRNCWSLSGRVLAARFFPSISEPILSAKILSRIMVPVLAPCSKR